jgi:hypothetical protein
MSEVTNQPLYLIKFDDTEVPDETMFGTEIANKRFEQISGNWNAHLFVKLASNSRDDVCSGSNARFASGYDAIAVQRDEGLAREAELQKENRLLRHESASFLETMAKTCAHLGIDTKSAQNAQGKPSDVLYAHAKVLRQRLAEATDLLKHMTCSYHRALENGYDRIIFLGGDCDSVDKMEGDDPYYARARAFLASPSRADQEQPS